MRSQDIAALLFLAALWGGSFLFMRIAAPILGAVWLIEIRVLLAGLILLPIALRVGLGKTMGQYWRSLLLVGSINLAIPFSLLAFASISLPAGFTSLLNATVPLFGTIISTLWLKEKLTAARTIGFVLGFIGVAILVGWKTVAITPGVLIAVGAGLLAAIMYAIAALYIRHQFTGVSSLAVATGSQIGAVVCLLPILPFTVPQHSPNSIVILSVVALAILCTALASIIYLRLIQQIGATKTMTVAYLIPFFAILWGALLLHEPLTPSMALGGGLVLFGTAISNEVLKLG
jgi:drug/metabolite transporter (DMT)-like permease